MAANSGITTITPEFVENALTLNARRFDKGGDNFYDQISALHKSVRGSHPDAACTGCAACSTAAPTPNTCRAASCAWPGKTSAWPTRAPCASPTTPPRPMSASARRKANWRWARP
jgi:hypothetical protein